MNLLELFADSLLDAGIDTLKLIPFLFVTYLIMEALERRTEDKSQDLIRKEKPVNVAGLGNDQWVAMDFVDVLVHIFLPEVRAYYDLEHLWEDAKLTHIPNLD